MITLKVPGMHCKNCVARIEKAFAQDGIGVRVSLREKTVEVDERDEARAVETLGDLGFDAER